MDAQPNWRAGTAASRLSYKNATIAVCVFNLLVAALLLHNYFSSWTRIASGGQFNSGLYKEDFQNQMTKGINTLLSIAVDLMATRSSTPSLMLTNGTLHTPEDSDKTDDKEAEDQMMQRG